MCVSGLLAYNKYIVAYKMFLPYFESVTYIIVQNTLFCFVFLKLTPMHPYSIKNNLTYVHLLGSKFKNLEFV